MRYDALLSDAVSYAGRLAVLAMVPLFASLARWSDVVATATADGFDFGFKFGFPYPIANLWTFVDGPSSTGGGVDVHFPTVVDAAGFGVTLAVTAFVFLVANGLLMAGYVGSIDQYVESGRYDFFRNVTDYGLRMVAYQFAVLAGGFGLVLPILITPGFFLVVLPVLLVLAYLFYLLPYLVVIEDRSLFGAVDRSASLAAGGGEPLAFFLLYAILVAAASFPLSLLTNAGLPGVFAAALLASGLGLFLTTFTVLFVRELVGDDEGATPSPEATPGVDAASGPD